MNLRLDIFSVVRWMRPKPTQTFPEAFMNSEFIEFHPERVKRSSWNSSVYLHRLSSHKSFDYLWIFQNKQLYAFPISDEQLYKITINNSFRPLRHNNAINEFYVNHWMPTQTFNYKVRNAMRCFNRQTLSSGVYENWNMSKSQLPMPSFVGSTSSSSYPPPKADKNENQQMTLCGCRKAPRSQCISAIGKG